MPKIIIISEEEAFIEKWAGHLEKMELDQFKADLDSVITEELDQLGGFRKDGIYRFWKDAEDSHADL